MKKSFIFRAYGWHGKSKRTFFETGKDVEAKASAVWRLIHRRKFEKKIKPDQLRKGQVIRVLLENDITDFTCFVNQVSDSQVSAIFTTGPKDGQSVVFSISRIVSIHEILSCPLFHRIKRKVSGEKIRGEKNIVWSMVDE